MAWWESAPAVDPVEAAIQIEGLDPQRAAIARSIYQQESSSGKNARTSNAGAVGGMQIIPATFNRMADEGWDINDPLHNARAGLRYINRLYDLADGDPRLTAVGYYGGEGAIPKARSGVAVSDPRNPNAPNTLQYGDQVASRIPQSGNWWDAAPMVESGPQASQAAPSQVPQTQIFLDETGGVRQVQNPNLPPELQNAAPVGSADSGGVMGGIAMGLRDPIDAGAQMLRRAIPDSVGQAVDQFGNYLADMGLPVARSEGVSGVDALVNDANRQYAADRAAAGRSGIDLARIGGNIGATAPMLFTPAGATSLGARMGIGAAQGAAIGALQPVVGEQNQQNYASALRNNALLGGVVGGAAPAVVGGISRLISPNASRPDSAARLLRSEGVNLTPGQIAGGVAGTVEDKLMSAPILGDAIRTARGRAQDQLNRAVYNRVLEPIGESTNKIGREAVREASQKVSQAYDDVLKNVAFQVDDAFNQQIQTLLGMSRDLPAREARQFRSILNREVIEPLSKGQAIDGIAFKQIESNLGEQAAKYLTSTDAYQKSLGQAIGEIQTALRQGLARLNPEHAQRLRSVNESFANLVRLQRAAGASGAADGVFTPSQLAQAVRSSDRTVRKNSYAQGRALMQDLSDAARSAMPSSIPSSGTAERLMLNAGALGSGFYNPAIPAGLVAASIPYLGPVNRAIGAAMTNRPAAAQPIADALRRLPAGAAAYFLTQ